MREAAIDAAVGAMLAARGDTVHYQVVCDGSRADIVAEQVVPGQTARLIVVESKVSASLALVRQALHWREFADEVWMAAPASPAGNLQAVAEACGLGVLSVCYDGSVLSVVRAHARQPKRVSVLRRALVPEQCGTEPGACAGFSTKWKRWTSRFRAEVERRGECALTEAVEASEPYFGSAGPYARRRLVEIKLRSSPFPPEFAGVVLAGRGKRARVSWASDVF